MLVPSLSKKKRHFFSSHLAQPLPKPVLGSAAALLGFHQPGRKRLWKKSLEKNILKVRTIPLHPLVAAQGWCHGDKG